MKRKKKSKLTTDLIAKMKGVKKARNWRFFSLGPSFFYYLSIVVTCFVINQELRDSVSAILLWFLLVLPIVSLAYLFACYVGVRAQISASTYALERRQSLSYHIMLKNKLPIPIGHVEADISLPTPDGAAVIGMRVNTTLAPYGESAVTDQINMLYHGRVQIGVERIYLYDPFRLFRLRRKFAIKRTIEILPRGLQFDTALGVPGQAYAAHVDLSKRGFDRNEQSDIRVYRAGDSVKDVHWKLSARSEELIVKEYDRTAGQRFYVVSDYSNYFHEDSKDAENIKFPATIGKYVATCVAEVSQAVLYRALEQGYDCYSVFRSVGDGRTENLPVSSEEVHRALFRRLTYQTEDPTPLDITTLALSIAEASGSVICLVVSNMTEELVKQIQRFTAVHTGQSFGRVLLYYVDCSVNISDPIYKDRFWKYQIGLLRRISHSIPVCCAREIADGSVEYYHPADVILS